MKRGDKRVGGVVSFAGEDDDFFDFSRRNFGEKFFGFVGDSGTGACHEFGFGIFRRSKKFFFEGDGFGAGENRSVHCRKKFFRGFPGS